MQKPRVALTRRQLLAAGTGLLGSSLVKAQVSSRKKTVAAIVTMYTDDRSLKSHASVIVGRMLRGLCAQQRPDRTANASGFDVYRPGARE